MNQPDTGAEHVIDRPGWHTALLSCGILGAVLFTTVYFCFSVIAPNYFMMRQPISDLQLQPYGWIQSVNYIIAGLLVWAFAAGLRKELVSGFGAVSIPLLHVLTGLGAILLGLFTDRQVQLYIGAFTFFALLASFFLLARRFAANPNWKGWARATVLTTIFMIVLTGLFINGMIHHRPFAGVLERLAVITRLVWLFFFTAKLLGGRSLARPAEVELEPGHQSIATP
jgi:hypothetical membrane protein